MSSASQPLDTVANAFRGLQLHNSELEEQLKDLMKKNIELQAEQRQLVQEKKDLLKRRNRDQNRPASGTKEKGGSRSGGSGPRDRSAAGGGGGRVGGDAGSGADAPQESQEMNAFQCGKYFVCAGEIWVRPSVLSLFSPPEKPAMAHDDPKRYDIVTPQLTLMGARADLYHLVPEGLHASMSSFVLFQSEFRRGAKEGRSTFISTIRKQMPTLFKLDATYFTVGNPEIRRSPEVAKYLKFNLQDAAYPDLPPFIFPNLRYNVKEMFRNDILIKALGIVLRGNGFITGSTQGTPDTNCRLWSVNTVTGPHDRFCYNDGKRLVFSSLTVFAISIDDLPKIVHLLSPGPKFQEKNTVIDLYRLHQLFKQLLISGRDNPHIRETIRIYQDEIFGDGVANEHIALEPEEQTAGNVANNLLDALWADTSVVVPTSPVPSPSSAHNAPRRDLSHVDKSSSSESSSSESSEMDDGKSSSGSEEEEDNEHEEDDDGEVIIELDEEVGGGTDYDDVYINPVSAPTSGGRVPSHCSAPSAKAAISPVAAVPIAAAVRPPVQPISARHSPTGPSIPPPLAPGPAASRASVQTASRALVSASFPDPGLPLTASVPRTSVRIESDVVAEVVVKKGKSKKPRTKDELSPDHPTPQVVGPAAVEDNPIVDPVTNDRRGRLRARAGPATKVVSSPEEPAKKPRVPKVLKAKVPKGSKDKAPAKSTKTRLTDQ